MDTSWIASVRQFVLDGRPLSYHIPLPGDECHDPLLYLPFVPGVGGTTLRSRRDSLGSCATRPASPSNATEATCLEHAAPTLVSSPCSLLRPPSCSITPPSGTQLTASQAPTGVHQKVAERRIECEKNLRRNIGLQNVLRRKIAEKALTDKPCTEKKEKRQNLPAISPLRVALKMRTRPPIQQHESCASQQLKRKDDTSRQALRLIKDINGNSRNKSIPLNLRIRAPTPANTDGERQDDGSDSIIATQTPALKLFLPSKGKAKQWRSMELRARSVENVSRPRVSHDPVEVARAASMRAWLKESIDEKGRGNK